MSVKNRTKAMKTKVKGPPVKADPHKQKATIAQFGILAQETQDAHKSLATKTNRAINELWRNQQEILQGLNAAEFNLRTHQKVMNAIALELWEINRRMPMPVGSGTNVAPTHLILKEVEVDGKMVYRIDWPAYHEMIEEELKATREAEKAAQEAAAKEAQEAAEKAKETPQPTEAPATPETTAPVEPGTVDAKEDGGPEIPDGATVFG